MTSSPDPAITIDQIATKTMGVASDFLRWLKEND